MQTQCNASVVTEVFDFWGLAHSGLKLEVCLLTPNLSLSKGLMEESVSLESHHNHLECPVISG